MHYNIEWYGNPLSTLINTLIRPGKVPYGGKHFRSEGQAREALRRFLNKCQYLSGTVEAAHSPRVVCIS